MQFICIGETEIMVGLKIMARLEYFRCNKQNPLRCHNCLVADSEFMQILVSGVKVGSSVLKDKVLF